MSLGPLALSPIIARIRQEVPLLRTVGGVAEAAAAQRGSLQGLPAAFVMLEEESASPTFGSSGAHLQRVSVRFAVLLAARNARDALGQALAETAGELAGELRRALVGWMPSTALTAIEFRQGRLLSFDDAVIWWQETYGCDYLLRMP
ncbi:MAG: hypothetical protein KatS3mg125_1379 [Lysobacterales bacterium]|nr:MAG: hypothetical protein KatS3mg125_1379 [Xanthomonadales bacterium]